MNPVTPVGNSTKAASIRRDCKTGEAAKARIKRRQIETTLKYQGADLINLIVFIMQIDRVSLNRKRFRSSHPT